MLKLGRPRVGRIRGYKNGAAVASQDRLQSVCPRNIENRGISCRAATVSSCNFVHSSNSESCTLSLFQTHLTVGEDVFHIDITCPEWSR